LFSKVFSGDWKSEVFYDMILKAKIRILSGDILARG
jgi:hypothetical protein